MTKYKQNQVIAFHCGWREAFPSQGEPHPETRKGGILLPYNWVNEVTGGRLVELPNYTEDLNSMQEAESTLGDKKEVYVFELIKLLHWSARKASTFVLIHATASKRAESFIKTIGKWEEE